MHGYGRDSEESWYLLSIVYFALLLVLIGNEPRCFPAMTPSTLPTAIVDVLQENHPEATDVPNYLYQARPIMR